MADDQTKIVKQPANGATYTRAASVGTSVAGATIVTAALLTYAFQVIDYFAPGFPAPDFIKDPLQLSAVSGAVAGLVGAIISYVVRGNTVQRDGQ